MDELLAKMQEQAIKKAMRVTQHAQEEMDEEDITLTEAREAIARGQILENYPDHLRGACCLLYGQTDEGFPLHIVCTTAQKLLVIITVYRPTLPKWISPTQRRGA